jgi:hypothetical protein
MLDPKKIKCFIDDEEVDCETWGEPMTEHEKAEMFYEECMENAAIKDYPPLSKDEGDEIESSLDFLSHYDS